MSKHFPLHHEHVDGLSRRGAYDGARNDEPQRFIVTRQEVQLEVNFRAKRVDGVTDIFVSTLSDRLDEIAIDSRQSEIDLGAITVEPLRGGAGSVPGNPKKVAASYVDKLCLLRIPKSWHITAEHHDICRSRAWPVMRTRDRDLDADSRDTTGCTPVDGSLRIKLRGRCELATVERTRLIIRKPTAGTETPTVWTQPRVEEGGQQYKITIPFKTRNMRDGLQFVGVDEGDMRFAHVYTRHSIDPGTACCIFPCVDDYGCRSEWKISITFPRTLGDALNQPLATQQEQQQQQQRGDHRSDTTSTRLYTLEERDKLLEMTAVGSGVLLDERLHPTDGSKKIVSFELEKRASVQKIGFAIGPFEHVDLWSSFRTEEDDEKVGASALKIDGYCLPNRAGLVRNSCVAIAAAADFLTLTFATHPFENFKLCFVDDLTDDAVPLYSFALASNRLLFPENVTETEVEVTRTLVHSLATQWSGSNMIANTRHDLWLVVGIAHFMTELFMKKLCGNNECRFRMKTLSDKLVQLDVNRPSLYQLGKYLHLGDFEMEFMALKASLVLFMLDKRMIKASGSAGLTKALSKLLVKAQVSDSDSVINTDQFKRQCEKNGKYKLESFWAQWVFGSGCPQFKVTQRFNKKRLCVEMSLRQVQDEEGARRRPIDRADFMRLVTESLHGVEPAEIQPLFTGPMTIRIHEADGTPYEHIVEIREEASRLSRFEIPYNTKYKRLRRNRRQRERMQTGGGGGSHGADANGEPGGEGAGALLYCLGDVLQGADEMAAWELHDWDADVERKMDQESYEWIRMDTDFEWICSMTTNLESYMYVSQLQQDRDVVAQQDSMVFLSASPRHPLVSTILTRTLVDRRYFYGIRRMAAALLPRHANIDGLPLLGLRHLIKAYREMFCHPGSQIPLPNNFADQQQYFVQCAILQAIANVRNGRGHCPDEGRRFLLDQLVYNNNEDNGYSDHHYVALLLRALATSLIPDVVAEPQPPRDGMALDVDDGGGGGGNDTADSRSILSAALDMIDRYRRRDEWELSYQNCWTVAALDAKQRLMKAGVIPTTGLDFVQYLQDETHELVRIKAFEALADLGLFTDPAIFRLMICVLSTDRSPLVRKRVMTALGDGVAALALGEHPAARADPIPEPSELVVLDSDQTLAAKKANFARREKLQDALAALKVDMDARFAHRDELQRAFRVAMDSPVLTRTEYWRLLELCSILFDDADNFLVTLQYPKKWRVSRAPPDRPGKCIVQFSSFHRTHRTHLDRDSAALAASQAPLPPPPVMSLDRNSTPYPAPPKRPVIIAKKIIKITTPKPLPTGLGIGILPALNPKLAQAELAAASCLSGKPPQARIPLPFSSPAAPSDRPPSPPPAIPLLAAPPLPNGTPRRVKTPKRPRPDKNGDSAALAPAAKKLKFEPKPPPPLPAALPDALSDTAASLLPPRPRGRIVTMRVRNLASVLGLPPSSAQHPRATTEPPDERETPTKPARKPLPDSLPPDRAVPDRPQTRALTPDRAVATPPPPAPVHRITIKLKAAQHGKSKS